MASVKDYNKKNDTDKAAEAAVAVEPPKEATAPEAPEALKETPKEAPKEAPKRPTRFLFISKFALIHDLAWQVQKEGFEVKYHIMSKADRDVGDGFVEKVDRWEDHKDWADVIVFDDCEFGSLVEKLRREGKAVIGGNSYTDKLEMDRDFGQEEMTASGLTTLPRWEFTSFDDAIAFVKENP